jgi:hypothetical protein
MFWYRIYKICFFFFLISVFGSWWGATARQPSRYGAPLMQGPSSIWPILVASSWPPHRTELGWQLLLLLLFVVGLVVFDGVRPQSEHHWNTVRSRTIHTEHRSYKRRRLPKFKTQFPDAPLPKTTRIYKYVKTSFRPKKSSIPGRMRTRRRHVLRKSFQETGAGTKTCPRQSLVRQVRQSGTVRCNKAAVFTP